MQRDTRIDTIRGFAMVTIVINHLSLSISRIGLQGPQIPTATTVSVSSAAEIFVALSGYMVGMVYLRKPNANALLIKRAGKLYAWNILLFIVALIFTTFSDQQYNTTFRLNPITTEPMQAVAYFMLLAYGPFLIDILQLYIILMLVSPIAVWLVRRSPILLITTSILTYCLFHIAFRFMPEIGGSPNPLEIDRWRFHPAAWQLMFFIPMTAGTMKLHEKAFRLLERRPQIFWITMIVFSVIGLVRILPGAPHIYLADRGTLGPVRLLHSFIVLLLYAGAVTILRDRSNNFIMQSFALIGRHSLNAFLLSTAATFVAVYVWHRWSLGWIGYVGLTLATLCLVLIAAKHWDRRKVVNRDEKLITA